MKAPEWERLESDTRGAVTALAASAPHVTFAATPVGVYRSVDGARNWQLSGARASVAFGECVAVEGSVVVVGAPDGLHRSTDSGQTWERELAGSRVTAVGIRAGVVLAGTDTDGVLRSEDAGQSWSGANAGLLDLEVLAVCLSPNLDTDRLAFVGTASGLYRSRNGGDSWRAVATGLNEPGIQCLAMGRDRLVVVGTEGEGALCSADGGATWYRPSDVADRSVTAVAISPSGGIAAATDIGTFLSVDGGQTWSHPTNGPRGVLALHYLEDGVLLAASERTGVWRSQADGARWTESAAGLDATLLSTLVVSADGTVWAAGLAEGVRIYRNGLWQEHNVGLAETTVLGLTIGRDDTAFAATPQGVYVSDGPSAEWSLALTKAVRAISADGSVVVAVADNVLVSSDLGRSWRSLDTPFEVANVISLVVHDGAILVGASGPTETVLWRSADDRHQWERWFVDPLPRATLPIAVSPAGVFIGLDRRVVSPDHQVAEFEAPVTAICTAADGTIWVGTTSGVFVSRDSGKTYQRSSAGPRRVIAVAASAGLVYALELGGQLWRHSDSG